MMCSMLVLAVPGGLLFNATADIDQSSSARPGEWCQVEAWGFERTKDMTLAITQNGKERTTVWTKDDWKNIGSMSQGTKGGGEETLIYGIYSASDDHTYLKRWDGDNSSLVSFEEVSDKTMKISFLVSEASGNNIMVTVSGTKEGKQASVTYEVPAEQMAGASIGLTYSIGGWSLKWVGPNGERGTWQTEHIHIYGIGFTGTVRSSISNHDGVVDEVDLAADDNVVHYRWDVPKTVPVGNYTATLSGKDFNGDQVSVSGTFYVDEEPIPMDHPAPVGMPSWLVSMPVVFSLILGVFLFSRIKRQKILRNLARGRIFEHIKKNPGIHFRAIQKDLKLNLGSVSHHLNILEREEQIKSYQDGVYRRFALAGTRPPLKIMLSNLQESILNVVKDNPGISQSNISKKVGKSRFVVNYHVKILGDVGMLLVEREGRKSQCYVTS